MARNVGSLSGSLKKIPSKANLPHAAKTEVRTRVAGEVGGGGPIPLGPPPRPCEEECLRSVPSPCTPTVEHGPWLTFEAPGAPQGALKAKAEALGRSVPQRQHETPH